MYVYQVPGAGFALGALGFAFYIGLHGADELFKPSTDKVADSEPYPRSPPSGLGHIALGCLLGLLISLAGVSAVIVPPTSLREWVMHRDPLHERVARAINPNKEWADLVIRERTARAASAKLEAENTALTKRTTDAEAALSKAQDELGSTVPNTVRAIVVKAKSGSRHANGLIYIGVQHSNTLSEASCFMIGSSDKMDSAPKLLKTGEAIKLATSKGTYRVILVDVAPHTCTFDLVKD
jgi:hypothetical protein